MKKIVTLFSVLVGLSMNSSAQVIWSNTITGTNPSSANPYTIGDVKDANVTVSGISRGTGITASSANDRYSASGWTTATTLDVNDYFSFTITPASTYHVTYTTLALTTQSSGTGPNTIVLRSSEDGYTANIGSPLTVPTGTSTPSTITLTGGSLAYATTAITFRLYAYNAGLAGGTFSVNDFSFNGSVSSAPLPLNLLSFTGRPQGNSLALQWTTGCENSMMPFEIEKSNGNGFTKIGTVAPTNNGCSAKGDYQFTDAELTNGTQLYRLKMTEFSGKVSYSNVLRFNSKVGMMSGITLSPNPASSFLQVSGLEAGVSYSISDAAGRVIVKGIAHSIVESVPVESLQSGLYFFQTPGSAAMKFVKQ